MTQIRIGEGFDVHALVAGRKLILGGVTIPYHLGLLGHSDADVLLHAITDALLGAAGLGDIGQHFPDNDDRWKGADSGELLRQALLSVQQDGWEIGNVDCTVIVQAPKLAPYREAIRHRIADLLGVDAAQVNVKGKTTERLGFVGRGEGIAASAVCLLLRD